ncbi:MAG: hypothetical protein Q9188_004817 [Gyalolechia gomerana]
MAKRGRPAKQAQPESTLSRLEEQAPKPDRRRGQKEVPPNHDQTGPPQAEPTLPRLEERIPRQARPEPTLPGLEERLPKQAQPEPTMPRPEVRLPKKARPCGHKEVRPNADHIGPPQSDSTLSGLEGPTVIDGPLTRESCKQEHGDDRGGQATLKFLGGF